jgi:hypothetical protein
MKKNNHKIPLSLLDPRSKLVSEKVYNKRYETCLSCPLLNKVAKTCYACGCFMKSEAALKNSFCPKDKWPS